MAFASVKIGDLCSTFYREHNQEAGHVAKWRAQGIMKVTVERLRQTEMWKAVRDFWDGSKKDNERSYCGIVINAVDRRN